MELDQKKFFQACNPSKTLKMEVEEERQYYIDFSTVRGGDIIKRLIRTISQEAEASDASCQLFTGHIGCGKSTELFRLKDELEKEKFHVVYFESSADMDLADVDVSDILLAITRQVSESLEKVGIKLKPNYFATLFHEAAEFLQTPIESINTELSLPLGIGKITAKTKESPRLRSQLRQYLEPRTSNILEAINKEVLGRATELLKQEGYKGLVVIIDNLDRIDTSLKPSGRSQPEYLFIDRGEQLRKLNCHVIYTIPLVLMFSNELASLKNRFGIQPAVLPMVRVKNRDQSDCVEGMDLLRQMVLARAFPKMSQEQRLNKVQEAFTSSEVLDRLCRMSGGHVRNLLVLLYSCLQREDPPLDSNCLENVIREYRDDLIAGIDANEWSLLQQIVQEKDIVKGEVEYQTLLRSMFLFEYRDDEGRWFDVNPAIAESKKLRQ
jgi:AAA ATPase domain